MTWCLCRRYAITCSHDTDATGSKSARRHDGTIPEVTGPHGPSRGAVAEAARLTRREMGDTTANIPRATGGLDQWPR